MSLKQTLLSVLQTISSQDEYISGQELAECCKVSRTAVWKAIEALRADGAAIEAVTNRGYRLVSDDIFNEDTIKKYIADPAVHIKFFEETDSTNTQAKRDLADSDGKSIHKTLYAAAKQSAGRGRLGRTFYSPDKSGIYFSLVYYQPNITKPALFTASAAVAVCRALDKVFNVQPEIKWVNDIYLNGKKICGILTEGIANFETGSIDSAIIGIGINISNNELFPEELKKIAGAVLPDSVSAKRAELCAQVVNELLLILDGDSKTKEGAMTEYRNKSFLIGKEIEVFPVINGNEKYLCKVLDVTDEAKLIVQLGNGENRILDSGEVSIHSKVVV